jgi:plasmid stability protein
MWRIHFAIGGDGMTNLSIRGLDDKALAELKARAAREDASVNTLVVRLIEQALGHQRAKPALRRHDDLDALAGSWRKNEAAAFERATAPFGEVDPQLWK